MLTWTDPKFLNRAEESTLGLKVPSRPGLEGGNGKTPASHRRRGADAAPEVSLTIMRIGNATLLLLLLAACGGDREASRDLAPGRPAGSEWITIEGVEFPAAFAEAPPGIVESYAFAARHPEVLQHMPCYCGCERETPPHRSNYDCFVNAIDRTGPVPRVDPDPMGFT